MTAHLTPRRPPGTGTVCRKRTSWVALAPAPRTGGGGQQIAKCDTRAQAERALTAWLTSNPQEP